MSFSITSKKRYLELGSFVTILLIGMFSTIAQGQVPTENIVENPENFQWTYHPAENDVEEHWSGVMEVGEASFTIDGESFTTRAYRQAGGNYSIPGPTMNVVPGNKYVLSFHNTLPYEVLSEDHNVFKDPNVSNMHTHGLHISGESPGDDVTRSFEGGRGGDFVYDIPSDHMGGTYWYHAHHHGSTFLQVAGGLFGMLIVDDGADGIPENVAAMTEREIILGFLDPAAAGTGGDVIMDGTLSATWTVNGLVEGNIIMPPDTWQHWRVLLADRAANMKTLEFGPGVEVMLLARDGVWRTLAPKEITTNQLEMTGASRADFAIRMTAADSWIKVDGTTVANIFTPGAGDADTSVHPFDTDGSSQWSANRPNYLRDLRNETNVNTESVSMGARTINGGKFDINEPTFSLPANQVQEWSLSGAVQHPFHLHVYHVQALRDDNDFEAGEYYDVVASKMSIRFDLNQSSSTVYDGRTILHCHILSHEDRGAMGWLDVDGGAGPPTFPDNTYSEYYILGGGTPMPPTDPSILTATETSSSTIDLKWMDNAGDEDGFDIERSLDGTNFTLLSSEPSFNGMGVVAYTDTELDPETTYWYRVSAYNTEGYSAFSNVASAMTQSSGGGVIMHVDAISVVRVPLNGNRFRANATITIFDSSNLPVSGATVNGSFTGPTTTSESGTTDGSGQVTFNTRALKNPGGTWCFEVTDVSMAGATYDHIVAEACEGTPFAQVRTQISKSSFTERALPSTTGLSVYPNPFKDKTNISFQLPVKMQTSLEVYTILGKRVAVITDRSYEAGRYVLEWDSNKLSSGMYFLRLKTGKMVNTRRLILIR